MKRKQLSKILLLTSFVWLWSAMKATATEVPKLEVQSKSIASVLRNSRSIKEVRQLSEIKFPSTSARMLVQSQTPSNPPNLGREIVLITSVKANATNKGVEIVLETTQGTRLQVTNRSTDNNFIVDVSGGQLRLPSGDAFTFRSEKPLAGITEITVTNIDANTVRVTVVGEKALPTVELFDDNAGLVFAVASAATATQPPQQPQTSQTEEKPASETPQNTPSAQQDEPIELVVTGEQDGYRVPNTSVGTRTNTPLRDIPQSIQIVPQEVLRDQNATTLSEALKNAPGVAQVQTSRAPFARFLIRGFFNFDDNNSNYLRNGLREGRLEPELAPNVERIEVLSGPASVLYGTGNLGGTINIVTKQPLRDPFYAVDATIGSYDFYRGAIDLSGPLSDSKTLLYRLNVGYLNSGSFVDNVRTENFTIAPVIRWDISERTRITLEGEYTDRSQVIDFGLPLVGTVFPNPNGDVPRNRYLGNPDGVFSIEQYRVGYRLEHQFSDNWSIQQAFQWRRNRDDTNEEYIPPGSLATDNRTVTNRGFFDRDEGSDSYDLNVNVTGKFLTGSIGHQLVFGVDLNRFDDFADYLRAPAAPVDLFNPVYGQPLGPFRADFFNVRNLTDTLGIYIQDQVTLAENLKLLLSGRFDLFKQSTEDLLANTESSQSGDGFSPRVGIVYQPVPPISLYASYSRSFTPVTGTSFEGDLFQPEKGTQYEVGVKADLNNRLSATLALYDLTRSGVLTADTRPGVPLNRFSIQTGEQRSKGIELSIAGEILPGWNIIVGYAYTDARLTEDNTFPVGNQLILAPENAVNFWTTYEIQRGSWKGFGVGAGLFFVGERQGDLGNTYQLPSYLRTDAAIFYRRDQFRAALNFRNLFDVKYFEAIFAPGVTYGEPFTVQGTISWQF
ncbi:TonB-dependent siderophore receptor [Scytonema sp. NUACC26]|uniref:TonB-dependent siderophore receptor n=1 Tax=Scytonema sp. NUACC26 TaxID=3140176 RepID=UPI0034DC994C